MADAHHVVKVEHPVPDSALAVVDLLALARAGPGRIDFAPTA